MQDQLSPRPVIVVFSALTLFAAFPLTLLALVSLAGGPGVLAWIFPAMQAGAAVAVVVPLAVGVAVGVFRAYRFALVASAALGVFALVNAAVFYHRVPHLPYLGVLTLGLSLLGALIGIAYLLLAWILHLAIRRQEQLPR